MSDELISGDPFDPHSQNEIVTQHEERLKEQNEQLQRLLRRRQEAYRRVFTGKPTEDDQKIVLSDLMLFCRGGETTFHENDRVHCLLTGRNEVYQRVEDHMRLNFDALLIKYNRALTREQ